MICFKSSFIESVSCVRRCGGNRPGLLQLPASHPLLRTHQLLPHHQPRGPLCHPSPPTGHCSCKYFQNKLRSSCVLHSCNKSSQNSFRIINSQWYRFNSQRALISWLAPVRCMQTEQTMLRTLSVQKFNINTWGLLAFLDCSLVAR